MQRETRDGSDPIERKVQFTGGSTYTVSIPKVWADDHGIESGSTIHIYPFSDRLVITQPTDDGSTWRVRIDVEAVGEESLRGRIGAAYAAGCDEIVIESDTRISTSVRRVVSQAITNLVGMEITDETERGLVARSLLDTTEMSLPETIGQIRGTALSMHENAVDAVVAGEATTDPEHVIARDDEVDRLFALVSRQFYRMLTDAREGNQLRADKRNAFTHFRTARQLERIADHAERIAAVADTQTEPPAGEIASEFESLGADARRVVRTALDGNAGEAMLRRDTVIERLDDLDSNLYDTQDETVYLYGRVLDSIRRTAEYGGNVAEIVTLSGMADHS